MPQHLIFLPMGALALLTFLVLILIPFRRFRAGFAGQVTAADFRFGESARVPGEVSIPNRNYMNLLEMPMLFYVICLMLYVSHRVQPGFCGSPGPMWDCACCTASCTSPTTGWCTA